MAFDEHTRLVSVSKMRQEDPLPCTAAFALGDLAGDRARGGH
jgi:hypothetical protein